MNKQQYDLTQGNILQKLLVVAIPIMGTQLLQMTYNLVDMYWLGRVGSDAVAASGSAGMFMWLSMAPLMVGRMGCEIGCAQSFGRKNSEEAKGYAQNALVVALVLALIFSAIFIVFRKPMIGFLNMQEANVVYDTEIYLLIVSIAMPFTFLTAVVSGMFSASGNAQTPFFANGIGLILNLILDPLCIFGLGMGVRGAALATALSQTCVFVVITLCLMRSHKRPFETFSWRFEVDREKIRAIFRWGVPIGIESMFFTLLTMITTRFQAAYGAQALAMVRVGSQIESLSWLLGGGFGAALTTMVAQNFGAKKTQRINESIKISLVTLVIWEAFVTLVLWFLGSQLIYMFLPDSTLIEPSARYMRILAVCQIPMALEFVYGSAFKGTGRTKQPAIASIASNAMRVMFAYLLGKTALGQFGIYWGLTLGAILRGVWMGTWYWMEERKMRKTLEVTK